MALSKGQGEIGTEAFVEDGDFSPDDDGDDGEARPTSAIEKHRLREEHMQQVMQKKPMFDSFFEHLPFDRVLQMSRSSRKTEGVEEDTTFGYGEIDYAAFADLILSLPVDFDVDLNLLPNFVDLGSGCGRLVFAAMCLGVFDKVTGIELLPELHKAAISAHRRYQRSDYDPDAAAEIDFIHADATFFDWSESDFVFTHSSAFDDAMMRRIGTTAEKLRPGAVLITLTHR